MAKTRNRYPAECPVFDRRDGVVYECVGVKGNELLLMCRRGYYNEEYGTGQVYSSELRFFGRSSVRAQTRAARSFLAIARGAR